MQKERRSFSIEIIKCDGFVDMSAEAQALYLQLVMACDDEGFTASTNICKAFAHASDQAEQELLDRKFILQIKGENRKVTVIKHWKTNNYFRDGKAKPSTFAERAQVYVKPNGNYTLDPSEGQPLVSKKQQPLSKKQGSMSKEQTPLSESSTDMPASYDARTGCASAPIPIQSNPKQSNPSNTPSKDSVLPTKQSNPIQSNANKEIEPVRTSKKQNALLQILIESGFIDEDELQDPQWEERLDQFVKERKQALGDKDGYVDAKMKVQFVISSISHTYFDGPDRNGKPIFRREIDRGVLNTIANKFLWFDAALDKAVRQMEAELPNYCPEDDDGEGQGSADNDPFK